MQSAFRIFARTSIQKRHFTNVKGSFYGFECSSYINRDYDLTLLEKSIRYGCRTVVGIYIYKSIYIFIFIYVCICLYVYIHIYIYV
jgi:hypothetical protein